MKSLLLVIALFVAIIMIAAGLSVPKVSAGFPDAGAELFKNNCARCHGADAKGGSGPDLTDPARRIKWKDSDERIVDQVTNGGRRMPSFADKLTAEEIKSVAAHVRAL
jgi:cytochrome c oxidase cbb3-type subunit 3